MSVNRPLKDVDINELQLELILRKGAAYQCQASDCRSIESYQGKWDSCTACGRKGYLSGGFVQDRESPEWKAWEERTAKLYRGQDNKVAA